MSQLFEEKASSCLESLGLTVCLSRFDSASQQAAANNWSYSHFLGYLLSAEVEERRKKTVALNLQFAKPEESPGAIFSIPVLKRLGDFDFLAQPGLDPRLIDELATGRFLYEGRNLVFLGPPGVGKTHLAVALGVMACEKGHRVYFTNALEMARRLSVAMERNALHRVKEIAPAISLR